MNFYNRDILHSLQQHLNRRPVTVITGLRRTGKTTLLKHLLSIFPGNNKIYLDLERLDNRELLGEKNYDNIISTFRARGLSDKEKMLIAIDEVQLVPGCVSVIKYLYDNYDIKFIITGSSSYYIKDLFNESLSGRKKVFQLNSLNFSEFLKFKSIALNSDPLSFRYFNNAEYQRLNFYYSEYIRFGGLPEVVMAETDDEKRDILNDILGSYLNIDIKNISDIRDQKNLHILLKMLAARVASRLDYSKLASLTGISRTTVTNYINLLEDTFMIFRVPVLSFNPDREIVKAQKVYFTDNGILNSLAEAGSGLQFENAVFNQLKFRGTLQYYSLKNGREIDFILNGQTAIEVKETGAPQDLKRLELLAGNINLKERYLISRHPIPGLTDFVWGGDIS